MQTIDTVIAPYIVYRVECFDHQGRLRWSENVPNLVTTEGKTDLISQYFAGVAYTAAFFLGLKGVGVVAVSDTLASHPGWTEQSPYAGNRPAIVWGATVSGSNTANPVVISVTAPATVAGAFLATISSGTSGKLYSASDFAASRNVFAGDTLNVTPTVVGS